jgi:hypothetical protein
VQTAIHSDYILKGLSGLFLDTLYGSAIKDERMRKISGNPVIKV